MTPSARDALQRYGYEQITPDADGRTHWRVFDAQDNRVATCYVEANAALVTDALNRAVLAAPPEMVLAATEDHPAVFREGSRLVARRAAQETAESDTASPALASAAGDRERLDWLDAQREEWWSPDGWISAYGWTLIRNVEDPRYSLRAAIDASMKADAARASVGGREP
jgi:hypothetical protein